METHHELTSALFSLILAGHLASSEFQSSTYPSPTITS